MLQCFAPAADMVVSSPNGLEDRLMHGQPGSAPLVRKAHRNHCLMERPARLVHESIGEDKPLWLDNLLIYAALSLYDPVVFVRRELPATSALLGDGMPVDKLRKYPGRPHGYRPGS